MKKWIEHNNAFYEAEGFLKIYTGADRLTLFLEAKNHSLRLGEAKDEEQAKSLEKVLGYELAGFLIANNFVVLRTIKLWKKALDVIEFGKSNRTT